MKTLQAGLALIFSGFVSMQASGQALPAGEVPSVGFQLPTVGGALHYSLSASESLSKGFYSGSTVGASTNLSGNVAFITQGQRHPFSMIYSGGYAFSNGNQPSSFFQNLAFSQVLTAGRWNFLVSDGISYLPQTATTGLSGIPGNGDIGVDPVQVGDTGLGILTDYGPRVNNSVSGSASHPISPNVSFQSSGTFTTLRYLGSSNSAAVNGLDNTSESGSGGLSYRINALSSVSGNYNYSRFSFGGESSFITQGGSASYTRQWTRKFSTNLSGGPQRSGSSDGTFNPTISLAVNAGLSYTGKLLGSSLSYSQGVSSGSGVIAGAKTNSLTGSVHRNFGRTLSVSGSIGYSRSKSIQTLTATMFSSDGGTASGQVSKSIGRYLSSFATYTVQDQRVNNSAVASNAFSGIYQTFGFGLSYSPGSINLGRR